MSAKIEGVDRELFTSWMCLFGAVARQEGWPLGEVRKLTNVVFDYWEREGLPPLKSEFDRHKN